MNSLNRDTYESTTYLELSQEFKELYPTVMRAFQLIAQMYNRLTLIDRISHNAALKKIYDDHKHLHGFSRRNIYRYLPSDNPNVPHRVMTRRHKFRKTVPIGTQKLSATKLSSHSQTDKINADNIALPGASNEFECPSCIHRLRKIEELEQALLAHSRFTPSNFLVGSNITYPIPKEKMYLLTEASEKSNKVCFASFDNSGKFVYAEADTQRTKQTVLDNGKN